MPVLALCEVLVQIYFAVHAVKTGREQEAKTLFGKIVKDARLSPKFYQKEQKEWINMARKEL